LFSTRNTVVPFRSSSCKSPDQNFGPFPSPSDDHAPKERSIGRWFESGSCKAVREPCLISRTVTQNSELYRVSRLLAAQSEHQLDSELKFTGISHSVNRSEGRVCLYYVEATA